MRTTIHFTNYQDLARLILRLLIAGIFLYHGTMKFGAWGPENGKMSEGMVTLIRVLSICEPLAALALIVGLLTQFASFGLMIPMIGVLFMRLPSGVPFGKYELETILLVMNIVNILLGPGKFSLDSYISRRKT